MQAVYASDINADDPVSGLRVGEQPEPQPRAYWSTISARSVTINHHDIWSLRGFGLSAKQLPMILGIDASGVLDEDLLSGDQGAGSHPWHTR